MTSTVDADILRDAIEIIDRGLATLLHRELVSATEASDLLLDVRSLLASTFDVGDLSELELPVPSN